MTYTKNGHTYTSEDGKYQIIGSKWSSKHWGVVEIGEQFNNGRRFIGVAHTLKRAKQMVDESKLPQPEYADYWGEHYS